MTDVYLRYYDDAEGAKIGDVPLTSDAIDEAVRLVKGWGVWTEQEDITSDLVAQFAIADGKAYFEIVVGKQDD